MGNGNCAIVIGGISYPLFFGRLAVEEFAKRTEKHLTDNFFKIATDMIYSGFINFQNRENLPVSPYSEVYDLVEEFFDQEDHKERFAEIDKTFFESKYGSEYGERIDKLKKKLEEETAKMREEVQTQNLNQTTGSD